MPIEINGQIYYRSSEVCKSTGISKSTLHRWTRKDHIVSGIPKDRNGWRLFTQADINKIKAELVRTNGD